MPWLMGHPTPHTIDYPNGDPRGNLGGARGHGLFGATGPGQTGRSSCKRQELGTRQGKEPRQGLKSTHMSPLNVRCSGNKFWGTPHKKTFDTRGRCPEHCCPIRSAVTLQCTMASKTPPANRTPVELHCGCGGSQRPAQGKAMRTSDRGIGHPSKAT